VVSGGRYLSCDDAMRVFAAGSATNTLRIEVAWRSGKRSVVDGVPANSQIVIDEATSVTPSVARSVLQQPPYFEDVSARLNHRHAEQGIDDFERQPLLPRKLSQFGPGITWCDIDGDGTDDLVVGSGSAGKASIFRNSGNGLFTAFTNALTEVKTTRDQSTIVSWFNASNEMSLIVGLRDDDGDTNGAALLQVGSRGSAVLVSGLSFNVGPIASADVDDDGALDLFVGGSPAAGHYPEPVAAFILRQHNGQLVRDPQNSWTNLGIVNGAVFTDLNSDGAPDLVLSCDWGPIRAFQNRRGRLHEVTAEMGLSKFLGWWTGVTAGDFDGDGRMDIVAANWGENGKYEFARAKPLRIYFGDFDGNGVTEIIESYFDPASQRYVPARRLDVFERGMPWVQREFSTWAQWSRTEVKDVLAPHFSTARFLEVNCVSTMVFLNRGDHFDPVRLPDEAQYSPAFGVCVADFDGDGSEDIFLAQNFFGMPADASRLDAGRGLYLRGNGRGQFESVPGQTSGIAIYGEQRGAAVCDFDQDGRVDLAVGQNAAETKLYRNTFARPGIRVRLAGPLGNPTAIGAVLRIGDGERWGAAREIHAGSGSWSQDSALQVMARTGDRVQVRWPGGTTTVTAVSTSALEVAINQHGAAKVVR
ncbi:MAG TPA: FG-GAP-like repeat-containing protein, partial [Candidatus Acidoferrum sp.]|nr:FG-GAP-like repeat-containing protein [Candidatus Acidoferrum sp.]